MTATKHTTLWCDFVGPHSADPPWEKYDEGERCVEWIDHGQSTAQLTRRLARQEGWRSKPPSDFCPRHALEGGDTEPPICGDSEHRHNGPCELYVGQGEDT